jgi:hypothetical protein
VIRDLDRRLDELEVRAGGARRFSPGQVATLERDLERIQQLLEDGRNGQGAPPV